MSRIFNDRRLIIIGIFASLFLILIIKLFSVQVTSSQYKVSAENNATRRVTIYPARGLVYDRNGKLLVYNKAVYDVNVVPGLVLEFDTVELCRILDIDKKELNASLKKARMYSYYQPTVIYKQLPAERNAELQEKLHRFRGFYTETRTLRSYPFHNAAHVLGFIGEVNRSDIQKNNYYSQGDYIGKTGVERYYEEDLRGQKGVRWLLVDVHNRVQGSYRGGRYDTAAVAGKDITLTIDVELQQYAEDLMKGKIGSVVAIEPATGEILALVSSPAYDPSLLVGRVRGKNYNLLLKDSLNPLFNRAIMAGYSPGSTFKMVAGMVGLQEGVINEHTYFSCAGPGTRPIRCSHSHVSPLGLVEAIEQSCNPYFWKTFQAVLEQPRFTTIQEGYGMWRNHVRSFGFGNKLGSDLYYELAGNIPGNEYYNYYYGEKGWRALTVRSLSIGQGELQITPLQMANMAATIANRGYYYTPHLAKKIQYGSIPREFIQMHSTSIDKQNFEPAIEGMNRVFEGDHGTARWFRLDSISQCGKTGTAENPGEDHSLFVAFAPMDNPKIAISVIAENAGFGSTWAAPIASLIMEKYIRGSILDTRKYTEKRMLEADFIHGAKD